jgi:hypothetical protein
MAQDGVGQVVRSDLIGGLSPEWDQTYVRFLEPSRPLRDPPPRDGAAFYGIKASILLMVWPSAISGGLTSDAARHRLVKSGPNASPSQNGAISLPGGFLNAG